MLITGTGMGMVMPVTLTAVQNAVPQSDLGVATSSSVFFRSMGASFGVAIFGAVMNERLRYWFPHFVHSTGRSEDLGHLRRLQQPGGRLQKLPPAIQNRHHRGVRALAPRRLPRVRHQVVLLTCFPIILLLEAAPAQLETAYVGSTSAMAEGAAEALRRTG